MFKLDLQLFAHKKGMGSTKNGRDSESKRLGVKKGDGPKIHPGVNVGKGSDDTLFALTDGRVKFERLGKDKKQVSVIAG